MQLHGEVLPMSPVRNVTHVSGRSKDLGMFLETLTALVQLWSNSGLTRLKLCLARGRRNEKSPADGLARLSLVRLPSGSAADQAKHIGRIRGA